MHKSNLLVLAFLACTSGFAAEHQYQLSTQDIRAAVDYASRPLHRHVDYRQLEHLDHHAEARLHLAQCTMSRLRTICQAPTRQKITSQKLVEFLILMRQRYYEGKDHKGFPVKSERTLSTQELRRTRTNRK